MESYGKLWKAMESYGKLWKAMESYGKLWKAGNVTHLFQVLPDDCMLSQSDSTLLPCDSGIARLSHMSHMKRGTSCVTSNNWSITLRTAHYNSVPDSTCHSAATEVAGRPAPGGLG